MREGMEAAITALLADEGAEVEPIPTATRKVWFSYSNCYS